MERIIKLKEYLVVVLFCIIGWILVFNNLNSIINWISIISPFKDNYSTDILMYSFVVFLYFTILLEVIIIRERVYPFHLEKLKPYKNTVAIVLIGLILLIHAVCWISIIYNYNFKFVIMVSGTVGLYRMLIHRIYIGNEYFIVLSKKYYFNKISSIVDEFGSNLCIRIDGKEYSVYCLSRRIKDRLIEIFIDKSINISER